MYIAIDSIGFQIDLNCGTDITGGTLSMAIWKPSGALMTKTVVVDDASTGQVHYTTVADDLDEAGVYKVRAKWEPGGGAIMYGEKTTFEVENL